MYKYKSWIRRTLQWKKLSVCILIPFIELLLNTNETNTRSVSSLDTRWLVRVWSSWWLFLSCFSSTTNHLSFGYHNLFDSEGNVTVTRSAIESSTPLVKSHTNCNVAVCIWFDLIPSIVPLFSRMFYLFNNNNLATMYCDDVL